MSDIQIVVALDENGEWLGNYAVDAVTRELPGVVHAELRDFPNAPVPTGRQIEIPIDPTDPSQGTQWVDELGLPGPGWLWNPNIPDWAGPPENIPGQGKP